MEAKFFLSKETLKTVNEFAFCLLIGQIGSSFFLWKKCFVSHLFFSCLWKNTSNCIVASQKNESKSNKETNFVWAKNWRERQKVAIWLSKWVLIVIWYWLSTQSDCEWDSSTTNFTRHLMRDKKQNWFFVVASWLETPPSWEKAKRCVYGLGFGRKRPNPRPSPKNACFHKSKSSKSFKSKFGRGFNILIMSSQILWAYMTNSFELWMYFLRKT